MSAIDHLQLASDALSPPSRPRIPLGGAIFFLTFIVMSPLLAAAGIKGIIILAGVLLLLLINGRLLFGTFQKVLYGYAAIYVLSAAAIATYWGTEVPVLFALLYVAVVLVMANVRRSELDSVVRYATVLTAIVIALGWIGLVYYLAGGGPIAAITNPDGRENLLYLTTFSNSFGDNYLRSGGIYDEPGAFSFFICTLCAVRELLGKDNRVTALLLVSGLVTASIAHMLYMIFHFAPYVLGAQRKRGLAVLLVSALALGAVLVSGRVQSIVSELVVERALKFQSGELENPRELQMLNVYRELSTQRLLLGYGQECVGRTQHCTQFVGGDFGENPLTPIVFGGLALGWPYYALILALIAYGCTARSRLPLIGFALILMQRPYALEFPYSATVFLVILAFVYRHRGEQQSASSEPVATASAS